MIRLELPYPPSANTYYRNVGGRVLISKKGREYRKRVAECVLVQGQVQKPLTCRLGVHVYLYPPDGRKRDLDNACGKALLDSLEKAHVYEDDCQIDLLYLYRMKVVKGGKVTVMVGEVGHCVTPS